MSFHMLKLPDEMIVKIMENLKDDTMSLHKFMTTCPRIEYLGKKLCIELFKDLKWALYINQERCSAIYLWYRILSSKSPNYRAIVECRTFGRYEPTPREYITQFTLFNLMYIAKFELDGCELDYRFLFGFIDSMENLKALRLDWISVDWSGCHETRSIEVLEFGNNRTKCKARGPYPQIRAKTLDCSRAWIDDIDAISSDLRNYLEANGHFVELLILSDYHADLDKVMSLSRFVLGLFQNLNLTIEVFNKDNFKELGAENHHNFQFLKQYTRSGVRKVSFVFKNYNTYD